MKINGEESVCVCGVILGDGCSCTSTPVKGNKRCPEHKGMRIRSSIPQKPKLVNPCRNAWGMNRSFCTPGRRRFVEGESRKEEGEVSCWEENGRCASTCGALKKSKNGTERSWDGMEYQMLLEILERVSWRDRLLSASKVSKTWMSAVLDLVLPCPAVIDLTVLDSPEFLASRHWRDRPLYLARIYTVLLKRRLKSLPPDSCSTLLLQRNMFFTVDDYIGSRTPWMQELIIPQQWAKKYTYILPLMKHWKRLKKLQCPSTMVLLWDCRSSIKEVEALHLFGPVEDRVATVIRDGLPRLRELRIDGCALSANALSIILDGHADLELLDTRHSFRVADPPSMDDKFKYLYWDKLHYKHKILEWNEDEIRVKAAAVKLHLQCARKLCSECDVPYRCVLPKKCL